MLNSAVAQLTSSKDAEKIFPSDAIARAKEYLEACKSTGAYSESKGTALMRKQVAEVKAANWSRLTFANAAELAALLVLVGSAG